jgi:hypothetical protein
MMQTRSKRALRIVGLRRQLTIPDVPKASYSHCIERAAKHLAFVAVYAVQHPGGAAWVDVLTGHAEGRPDRAWRYDANGEAIELLFASDEIRRTVTGGIWGVEHMRPIRLYDDETVP